MRKRVFVVHEARGAQVRLHRLIPAHEVDLHIRHVAFAVFIIREIVRVPKLRSGFIAAKVIGQGIASGRSLICSS